MLRCLLALTFALRVNASGDSIPVWMPAKLREARDSAAAASSRPGFKPYQRNPRPKNSGSIADITRKLKMAPSRFIFGSKEFATDFGSTVRAKVSRGQESIAESLRAQRVFSDSLKVVIAATLKSTAITYALFMPDFICPSTMFGELAQVDAVAKRHRERVQVSSRCEKV